MCGIVGAIAERNVEAILIEGLKRLEYRGYDSAGLAIQKQDKTISRQRALGKVSQLEEGLASSPVKGSIGVAHTRWATHGEPAECNAHPHMSEENIALVHNGIIENYEEIKNELVSEGIKFCSQTDSESIVHLIGKYKKQGQDILYSVLETIKHLEGAFALGVIDNEEERLIAARSGSPLVIGLGIGENFIASDVSALLPVTQQFIFLEEGDIADITRESIVIYDKDGDEVERPMKKSEISADAVERGEYRHYMLKEIYEQPKAVADTLEGRIDNAHVFSNSFGYGAEKIFKEIESIYIIACGTSYHAGLVAKYWFEGIVGIPCMIEVASEFRYRKAVYSKKTLIVTISQSGETADTLAALREAKKQGAQHSLVICNVPQSSLVRESSLAFMTHAGPEIGVASTKAFTTQLTALLILVVCIAKEKGNTKLEAEAVNALRRLPRQIEKALLLDKEIEELSKEFSDKHHTLFLGRGTQYPIAMEGALKLKEISYIHAEAYPAGELKHGPLALVDADMPVVAVAPNNDLIGKLKSNLQEVKTRGGTLYVFSDSHADLEEEESIKVIKVGEIDSLIAPMVFTIPLQLLSYHVAIIKGTDVDQPRNLAKSVTVE
ncbi:MAG: glutamine--fructose-6-phosphate transaminase (isomerizing) [gamma proteobacterium symbiont of Bathyaustriella thionipta]|nr:glutamine--fructose-6-phosphate transaminase (isomerizing) [gamma proteobacterium symbiont of Bathyaustriella thionipta]MCU7949188.1 glutamine--fructose-6-phosphate transaminase (isomerizing) [gamma proteobacterium symbiont of Bathyaustriella thionipta]MCU7952078.1 glutamine--fructose-6-phosphate transaminase (isomerizing) [gamma proteobacterium symbiont of Bathyaustriella thionipta]MCU7955770.1 glutamine--fructose-6-phosphate transaminase (isomerizing) [gamma proteobacterium symbiont of Bath